MSSNKARPEHIPASRFLLVLVLIIQFEGMSFDPSEIEILLKFKGALEDNGALNNWFPDISPCSWNHPNWNGVLCSNGSIWGLKLEHMGLKGVLDVDSLGSIKSLRTLSLMNNKFEGPFPDVKKLGALKSVYLSNNGFSGTIPDDAFAGMSMLKKLHLANNRLSGHIPSSIAALPKLLELRLNNNKFEGKIPDFKQPTLTTINLSNNELEGEIPASLSKMDAPSFTGNKNLCGPPLDACPPPPSQPPPLAAELSQENDSAMKIVTIVIAVALVIALIAAALIMFCRKNKKSQMDRASSLEGSNSMRDISLVGNVGVVYNPPPQAAEPPKKPEYGKLSFVRDDEQKFDLQDLLKSSAEVLGSGTFGASYKTGVQGRMYVVKRYKQMNKSGRDDFHEHMRRIGRLSHPNLLPLVAYYYRKEEKLLVYAFVDNGSLANKLHGKQKIDQHGLDWPRRLKIIKGVVKGLVYLHSEIHNPVLPYGHLKSSNVLLGKSFDPLLTDYTLRPVINPESAHKFMVAYKSPEFARTGSISKRSDVWSLGILILEVLTGKFPEDFLLAQYDSDTSLSTWVNQMVKEKRLTEVFDKEMVEVKHSKGEMINLLKIGLSCCEEDAETRISLKDAAEKIEEIKVVNSNNQEANTFTSSVSPEEESSFLMHG